ncbi:MAG TPA: 5-formyltetrahydrofolate cyclo-ligase [Micropepsaceae bacterium]|jgi:5-formyltetrahydrofolate cyclo-ligase|nr:5-formyltetrahydrofolate cyclo-ligase [Micropepsaceae bacterium]
MTITALKEEVRKEALARRAALQSEVPALSRRIAQIFADTIPIPPHSVVSAYVAIGDEADPAPLLEILRARGHVVALPRVVKRGLPLDFHVWESGAKLVPGGFGLSEPSRDWPKIAPDVLAVPLLGFDAKGYRIGYGAGFYDRTLAGLRASKTVLAAGYCFRVQEFADLPHDENDQRLDWIVTEESARRLTTGPE